MPKFLHPIDLTKNELQNVTIQNLGTAPASAPKGSFYYDTAAERLKVNIGTTGTPNWVTLSSSVDTGNSFSTITTPSGTSPVADAQADTLTLATSNSMLTITGDSTTDTITFAVVNSTIDHNSLANLTTGDPHSQYVHVSTARTISAAHTFSATQAFTHATSAFTVTSTTLITNLNADRVDGANASATPTASTIPIADGSNKLAVGWISQVLAASDLTNGVTGTGAVVLTTSPTIVTPTIASFTNAQHSHQNAAGGGTLDHGLALVGLGDDDHTQYALLAGRAATQTLIGSTATTGGLILTGSSSGAATTGHWVNVNSAYKVHQYTRALPTTTNGTIEVCTVTPTNLTAYFEVVVSTTTASLRTQKAYAFPVAENTANNAFQKVIPIRETGAHGTHDFDLELSVASTSGAVILRLRRTGSAVTAVSANVSLAYYGTPADSLTASTAASTSAITAIYAYSGMDQISGGTILNGQTLSMGTTLAITTGGGTLNMSGGAITNAGNITSTGTITAATFSGAFSGTFGFGAQATPSISFTGRTDVGFWSPSANTIALVSNNTEFFSVNSTGIGFFGATEVAKQGSTTDLKDVLVNYGLLTDGGGTPLNLDGGTLFVSTISADDDQTTGTNLNITAAASTAGAGTGGGVNITAGANSTASANGGSVSITPGEASSGTSGVVTINQSSGVSVIKVASSSGTAQLGFFNQTPVSRAVNTSDIKDALANYGLIVNGGATPLNLDGGALTAGAVNVGADSTWTDGVDIAVGTTTGTMIGTAAAQKLGFFGATPVIQQVNTTDIKDVLINLGFMAAGTSASPLNLDGGALTAGASSFSGAVAMGNNKITGLGTPTADTDAATKAYVDATATGLDFKQSVRASSTANVTVTYTATGGSSARGQITAAPNTLDGVTLAATNRILLKNQSTPAQNGIWIVSTLGTGEDGIWDRATDFDQDAEVTSGAFVFVEEGTANNNSGWVLDNANPIIIGGASGSALSFVQFSGAGTYVAGNGLTLTGSTFDVVANNGIVANANDIGLTGLALALHNLSAVDGIIAKTGASTVSARTITGTATRLTVTNGGGAAGNPTIDIDSAYVGQTSLTTVGTITTGTWNATDVAVAAGGTGSSTAAGAKINLGFVTKATQFTVTGDSTTASFAFTHGFGTAGDNQPQNVQVTVRESVSPFAVVYPDVRMTDTNTVTIVFGIAPATGTNYIVQVQG